jgi:mRNA interferase MazF
VPVGPRNGLDRDSVVSCDNITTVRVDAIGDAFDLFLP